MPTNTSRTIYRYDSRGSGFKKVALFLFTLALFMVIFGIYWLYTWI